MRNKIIFGLILLVNFLGYSQDIDLTLKYNTTLNRYEVYARPDFTQNNFTWGPSQISVVVPASVANSPLQNLTSFNAGNWGDNSIIYAPTPQPQSDFHGVDSGGSLTNLVAGEELLIFSFTINGGCVPGLRLFNIGVDPDSSDPGMFGGDFRNSIDNGMLTDVYNANYNNSGTVCIDAIDDNMSINFPNGGVIGNVFADNDFGQDTLYGTPISNPALVSITVLDPDGITGLTISPSGDVNVPANTDPGNYEVIYQICEVAIPSNCDSATIFITVNAQIIAEDDTITANEADGTIGNIFPNNGVAPDTLNGNPITVGSTVIITLISNGGLTGLAIDNNGDITIPINSNVNNGVPYVAEYQICDALNPGICDTAFITITIEPSIIAEDDNNFTISTSEQGVVGNIFANNGNGIDSLETIAITNPALVNITIFGVSPLPGLVINASGDIFVPLNTVAQSYSIQYQICEVANPSNCDTAIFIIYVIETEDDSATVQENSFVDIDIYFNDTLFIGDPNVPLYGTLTISTLPTNGTVTITDPNATPLDPTDDIVTYTPNANYSGPDSFEYTVCNNNTPTANCDTALVTINVTANSADIVTVKTDNSATYTPGTNVTYTITVTNNGPDDATNVVVSDALPSGITTATWSGDNGSSGTGALLDTLPTLANGTTVIYTLTLTVPSSYTGNLTNVVTITSDTSDPNPSCPTCTDIDTPLLVIDAVNDPFGPVANNVPHTIDILNNDTLNGAPFGPSVVSVTMIDLTIIPGSLYNTATGEFTVPVGTTPGTYTIPYTICEVANISNCDSANIIVIVEDPAIPNTIDAVNDTTNPVDGTVVSTPVNILTNDILNGNPITNPSLVIITVGTSFQNTPTGGLSINTTTGLVTVLAGTPPGIYTATYTICEVGNPTNCDTANVIIVVEDPTETNVIIANDDNMSSTPVNQTIGNPNLVNALTSNDSLNGITFIDASTVTISVLTPATNSGVSLNTSDGNVSVAIGTPAGTYVITYMICEIASPDNCDVANITVVVDSNTTNAIADINVTYVDTPV
uniref:Ig-like domain-containing protein n=1 Tax=uncultured Flavobacterium sp. TaxID=165435 RepID=UPI0030EEC6CF